MRNAVWLSWSLSNLSKRGLRNTAKITHTRANADTAKIRAMFRHILQEFRKRLHFFPLRRSGQPRRPIITTGSHRFFCVKVSEYIGLDCRAGLNAKVSISWPPCKITKFQSKVFAPSASLNDAFPVQLATSTDTSSAGEAYDTHICSL